MTRALPQLVFAAAMIAAVLAAPLAETQQPTPAAGFQGDRWTPTLGGPVRPELRSPAYEAARFTPAVPLPIDAPDRVDTGELVIVQSATSATAIAWALIPQRQFMRGENGKAIAFSSGKKVGDLVVILATVEDGQPRLYQRTIAVGPPEPEPAPEPKPGPTPDPPQPPTPTKPVSWAIIVRESGDQTPAQAEVIAAMKPRRLCRLRVVDPDNAQPEYAPFVALARSGGKSLPWLILTAEDGTILAETALPDTAAAFVALLKKHGGTER